jgi:hypothetical protein
MQDVIDSGLTTTGSKTPHHKATGCEKIPEQEASYNKAYYHSPSIFNFLSICKSMFYK